MCSALQLTCSIPSCIEGTTYPTSPLHPFMYEFHFLVQLLSASMCAPTGCASALPCKSAPEGEGGLWRFQCTGVLFKGLLFQRVHSYRLGSPYPNSVQQKSICLRIATVGFLRNEEIVQSCFGKTNAKFLIDFLCLHTSPARPRQRPQATWSPAWSLE
jgi:hypothetical protein